MILIDRQVTARHIRRLATAELVVIMTAVGPATVVAADGQVAERLLKCDEIVEPAERLVCLDSVVDSLRSDRLPGDGGGQNDRNETAAAAATEQMEPEKPFLPEPYAVAAKKADAEVDAAPAGEDSGQLETIAAPSAGEAGHVARREKIARENSHTPIPFEATITSVRTHSDGRFSVKLDNGETWRETQGTRVRTPTTGHSVEVYEGSMGGRRMKIEGVPQTAWVRRVD